MVKCGQGPGGGTWKERGGNEAGFIWPLVRGGKALPKRAPTGAHVPTEAFWALLSGTPEMTRGTENNGPGFASSEGGWHRLTSVAWHSLRALCSTSFVRGPGGIEVF